MNELIISSEIRVIADDGEKLGVWTRSDALARAPVVGLAVRAEADGAECRAGA